MRNKLLEDESRAQGITDDYITWFLRMFHSETDLPSVGLELKRAINMKQRVMDYREEELQDIKKYDVIVKKKYLKSAMQYVIMTYFNAHDINVKEEELLSHIEKAIRYSIPVDAAIYKTIIHTQYPKHGFVRKIHKRLSHEYIKLLDGTENDYKKLDNEIVVGVYGEIITEAVKHSLFTGKVLSTDEEE
jgi:hypothetical protein